MRPQSPSPLLSLPGEIRTMILQYLLVPSSRHMLFMIGRQSNAALCLQVLRTCRQLLKEGLPLLYGRSVIEADFPPKRHEPLFYRLDPSCIGMIRRMSLPADNDLDDLEEGRDFVQGATNLRLAAFLQNYSTNLGGLQMLRLEFEQDFPPPFDDYDPYFEHLNLWAEFENPHTTEERRNQICNKAVDFAFKWTVLRAYHAVCNGLPELANYVYDCVDCTEDRNWIVFTRMPLLTSEDIASEVGIETGTWKPLEVDLSNTFVRRGKMVAF